MTEMTELRFSLICSHQVVGFANKPSGFQSKKARIKILIICVDTTFEGKYQTPETTAVCAALIPHYTYSTNMVLGHIGLVESRVNI